MHGTRVKNWIRTSASHWWEIQVRDINAFMAAIDASPPIIRNRRDLVVAWIKIVLGGAFALLLFYLALTHGGTKP
jgi:hypothetical protein